MTINELIARMVSEMKRMGYSDVTVWGEQIKRLGYFTESIIAVRGGLFIIRMLQMNTSDFRKNVTKLEKSVMKPLRSNSSHEGPRKCTEEDDVRFARSFEKLILMAKSKEGAQSGTL